MNKELRTQSGRIVCSCHGAQLRRTFVGIEWKKLGLWPVKAPLFCVLQPRLRLDKDRGARYMTKRSVEGGLKAREGA